MSNLMLVSRCCRNWPSWLQARISKAGSLKIPPENKVKHCDGKTRNESQSWRTYTSMWMIKLIASNSTAFFALECWTFLDFGGSCALFKIMSRHSFNLDRVPGSSIRSRRKQKVRESSFQSENKDKKTNRTADNFPAVGAVSPTATAPVRSSTCSLVDRYMAIAQSKI